jgi:siroheme synthase
VIVAEQEHDDHGQLLVGEAGFGTTGDENEIDTLMAGLATHGKRVVRLKSGYPAATAAPGAPRAQSR